MKELWLDINIKKIILINQSNNETSNGFFNYKNREIIPLKSIEGARRMKAGPLYDKTFHYVQVNYLIKKG